MRYVVLFLLLNSLPVAGQQFTTSIQPQKIEVGGVFTLLLEVESDENWGLAKDLPRYLLRPNPEKESPDTIDLEFVEEFGDSVLLIQGKKYYQILAKAMCFDTGLFLYAPSPIIRAADTFRFDAQVCRVDFIQGTEAGPIKDIEEIFAEIPDEPFSFMNFLKSFWGWFLGVALAALLAVIFWKRKKKEEDQSVNSESLKEVILGQFDDLCSKRLWEKESLEAHFVPVVNILRNYLGKEFGYQLQHKTTFEILFLLEKEGLKAWDKQELSIFLEVSDLIKFAQSQMAAGGVEVINLRIRKFLIEFEK